MKTFALALVMLFATQAPPAPAAQAAPDVTGEWTGTWSSYNPAQPAVPPKEQCKTLTAKVAKKDDGYQATFEGDCGRPYKYAITMEGRAAGKTVLFKGTADLGPKDGGVYDSGSAGRRTRNSSASIQTLTTPASSPSRARNDRRAQGSGLKAQARSSRVRSKGFA